MTNEQAKKQAQKRWGKKYAVRNSGHISGQERRDAASEKIRQLRADKDAIDNEITERLKACDWYQSLKRRQGELAKEIQNTIPEAHRHRFDVGRIGGVSGFQFFEVLGSGDTWEEAFAQADQRTVQP
jgi:hypothetical protein